MPHGNRQSHSRTWFKFLDWLHLHPLVLRRFAVVCALSSNINRIEFFTFHDKNVTHAIQASIIISRKVIHIIYWSESAFLFQLCLLGQRDHSWILLAASSSACNAWIASINFIIHLSQLVTLLPNPVTTWNFQLIFHFFGGDIQRCYHTNVLRFIVMIKFYYFNKQVSEFYPSSEASA